MADTDSSSADQDPSYALLGDHPCNQSLPQNEIIREVSFGRLITVSYSMVPSSAGRRGLVSGAVLPLTFINPILSDANTPPDAIPLKKLQHPVREQQERVPIVEVANVAELIATRKVVVEQSLVDIVLDRSAIANLLHGGEAVVTLANAKEPGTVRLNAARARDAVRAPIPKSHLILDITGFLARPHLALSNGSALKVGLTPENVTDLIRGRGTEVTHEGERLTLVPQVPDDPAALCMTQSAIQSGSVQYLSSTPIREPGGVGVAVTPPYKDFLGARPTAPAATQSAPQLGFFVPYLQTWKLLGYSRGALLNTIALAPQEETTIELFTWDRRTNALEQTSTSEVEQNIESTDSTKDTKQVVDELAHDSNFHADAHTEVNVSVKAADVGGTYGGGLNAGGQTGAKDAAKNTTELIHESTRKAVTRVKATRQSKVSESHEFGSEQRNTRKIKNVNMCRTLNLDYFEVLVNYRIETVCQRRDARLVVMLPLPEPYDWKSRDTLRRFEPILRMSLLDRAFVGGFAAARLLASRDEAFKAVCEKCVCADEGSRGPTSDGVELDDLLAAAFDILVTMRSVLLMPDSDIFAVALDTVAPRSPPPLPDLDMVVGGRFRRWLFWLVMTKKAAVVWSGLRALVASGVPIKASDIPIAQLRLIRATTASSDTAAPLSDAVNLDDKGREDLRATLKPAAMAFYKGISQDQLQALGFALAATIPDPIVAGLTALINLLIANAAESAVEDLAARAGIAAVEAKYGLNPDDLGLIGKIAAFTEAYKAWEAANSDLLKHSQQVADALDKLANTRNDEIRNAFPLSAVSEARERESALVMHLQDNTDFYTFAVYQAQITTGAAKLPTLVSDSHGLISSNAMGIVDGKLAFPLELGDFVPGAPPNGMDALRAWLDEEIRKNTELDDGPSPSPFSLPTPGIALEMRLGSCDGCEEFVMKARDIDLRQKGALARQAEAEASRFEMRLKEAKPELSDPTPDRHEPSVTVKLLQDPATPPK